MIVRALPDLSCLVSDRTGIKTHERTMESGLPVTGCRPPLPSLFKAYAARFAETLGAQSTGEDTNLHGQGFSIPDLHGPAGYLFFNDPGDH